MVHTRILDITGSDADRDAIMEAAAALREGMLVVFPTETVYGIGCNALMEESVRRIYDIKGRPWNKPLAFYVSSKREVLRYIDTIPTGAEALMDLFWPGPLTVLLPGRGKGERVGFRCPADSTARALIRECGVPVVATSANRSGCPCPLNGEDAVRAMDNLADIVVKGGTTQHRRESTIVDLAGEEPVVIRAGVIPRGDIEAAIGLGRAAGWEGGEPS
jgi:L-threonylcarbamoyladenylate synthase